jgi:hypothetical protein
MPGWVKQHAVETNSKGGRPSESWELHPEAELYFGEYYSSELQVGWPLSLIR